MYEIILDTETTGLSPRNGDRIIEIAAIKMQNMCLTGDKIHHYIDPQREVSDGAYRIHGISTESLKGKPKFGELAHEFLEFISGASKIVAHNAQFDIDFINHELSIAGLPSLMGYEVVDTLDMARKKFPGAKCNLDALCKRFSVDNSGRTLHGALKDAALLAEVYVGLLGGRQSAFSITSENDEVESANQKSDLSFAANAKILQPSKEEIEKHKSFVTEFCKNPLWARVKY